jgi:hypothetical protein
MTNNHIHTNLTPWNKGNLIGQKPSLRLHEIWTIRIRLEVANESHVNLQANKKPACYSVITRAYKARKHRSVFRYLGIEVDDPLEMPEQIDC